MASFWLPDPGRLLTGSGIGSAALNASNNGCATIFAAHKTGTINQIFANQASKTGVAPTYRYGVEGVATHAPDGTYKNSGNAYVDVADPANGGAWLTLGATVPVTIGDMIAATIRYQSGTIGASNNITINHRLANSSVYASPYAAVLSGGTWTPSMAGLPILSLKYDDGTVMDWACAATFGNNIWNSGSSPLYRGTKFTPNVTCRCHGAWIGITLPNGVNLNVSIYAGSDTSPTVTAAVTPTSMFASATTVGPAFVPFPLTTLTAGTIYRLIIEPTTGTNTGAFTVFTFSDAASLRAYYGDLVGTQGVAGSPPTWTDFDNVTNGFRAYMIMPAIDDITSGGGNPRQIKRIGGKSIT